MLEVILEQRKNLKVNPEHGKAKFRIVCESYIIVDDLWKRHIMKWKIIQTETADLGVQHKDGAKNQDGGKPAKKRNEYNCDDCGMQFNTLGAFRIHSTIHRFFNMHFGFKQIFYKTFFSFLNVKFKFSGVKDWLCTDCGKRQDSDSVNDESIFFHDPLL